MQLTPRPGRSEYSEIPVWWIVGILATVVVVAPFEGNDYPAQVFHTVFADHLGGAFNLQWFSGHHVAGYGSCWRRSPPRSGSAPPESSARS